MLLLPNDLRPSDDQQRSLAFLTLIFRAKPFRPNHHLLQLPVKGIQVGEVLLLGLWRCVTHG